MSNEWWERGRLARTPEISQLNLMTDFQPPASDSPGNEAETWEGETRAALFLRALFTLLAGGFLAWAMAQAKIPSGAQWNRWVWFHVIASFLLPLGIVWMFFGQGLLRFGWMSDQRWNEKWNAWNYGWDFRNWQRHLKYSAAMFVAMLPVLWFFSRDATMREYYHSYLPQVNDARGWLWLLVSLIIYIFCWEWFHRGFLLFGMAQGFGPIIAIIFQTIIFGWMHWGKPGVEFYSSFPGGAVLGVIAWREKSFAPAFYTHALIHLAWVILVLL